MSNEEIDKEEIKNEIEQLEAPAEEPTEEAPQEPPTEQEPQQEPPQQTPPEQQKEPDILEELRKKKQLTTEILDLIRQTSNATPEQLAITRDIIEKIMVEPKKKTETETPKVITKEVIKEKPVEKVIEKPVIPPELTEHLSALEEKTSKYDIILDKLSEAIDQNKNLSNEIARLRQELDQTKLEYQQRLQQLQQQTMIIPKTRITRPDGVQVEEYDFHPALKMYEKRSEYLYDKLGPSFLEELRGMRSDIGSTLNRISAMLETVLTPELKRRAPELAEDIQERFRRLVGGALTAEQREKELESLENKLKEATAINTAIKETIKEGVKEVGGGNK